MYRKTYVEINIDKLTTYGKNRLLLEQFVEKNYDNYLIVRLPALFGKGLKKNLLTILTVIIVTLAMVAITVFAINFSAIYFILLGALIGIIVYALLPKKKGGKKWFISNCF